MGKCKYETHVAPNLDRIAKWAELGASQSEIARKLKLGVSTFKLYLSRGEKGEEPYTELAEVMKSACEIPDDEVESAMYKSALGYTAKVAKHYKLKKVSYDPDTGKKMFEEEELVEAFDEVHVPANVTAQMFWLANRRPDRWRYKPEPVDGDADEGTGVVELPAVMEVPEPPGEVR